MLSTPTSSTVAMSARICSTATCPAVCGRPRPTDLRHHPSRCTRPATRGAAARTAGIATLTVWLTECKYLGVDTNESTAIKQLVDRLRLTYPDVPPQTVSTVVRHNHARFDGRPVRNF